MNVFWKAMTIFTTDEVKSTQLVLFNKATSMLEMKEIINRTASFVIQMNRKKVPSYDDFYRTFSNEESNPNAILFKFIGIILDKTGFLFSIKNIQNAFENQGKTGSKGNLKNEVRTFLNLVLDILLTIRHNLKPLDVELLVEIVRRNLWKKSKNDISPNHSRQVITQEIEETEAFQCLAIVNSRKLEQMKLKRTKNRNPIETELDNRYKFNNWLELKLAVTKLGLQMHTSELFTISATQSRHNYSIDSSVGFIQENFLAILKEYRLKTKMIRCYGLVILAVLRMILF